jgi:hypothetical protein
MPAIVDSAAVTSRRTVAGKRGRKSAFNSAEFKCDVGAILDVTEEMSAGIDHYVENAENADAFTLADLFAGENATANKYRGVRFGALKRAAVTANGDDTKYSLEVCERTNEEDETVEFWGLVRTR